MALTVFRYYFNKLDNVQRTELAEELGIAIETIYRRLKTGGQTLTLKEAKIFCDQVEKHLNTRPRLDQLTEELMPEEEEQ